MSTVGSYPVGAFAENKYFLVYDPSSQTLVRVLGSDLVNYITPDAGYVRTATTRATAQTQDYDVGIFIQVAGSTAIGDGGSSMLLVVAAGEGDFVMNNGNELLVLPRGSLAGSDLDGALVTDNGVQRQIQTAITSRPVEFESFAAIMLEDLSGYDYAATTGFYGGWAATLAGPKGGATYHRDGTTGTASTAYTNNNGFFDANGDGFRLSVSQKLDVYMFGCYMDGSTDDSGNLQKAENYIGSLDDGTTGNRVLRFGPGVMALESGITWKGGWWEGEGSTSGTRVIWNGTAGVTAITRQNAIIGGLSFASIKGINFRKGSAKPGTWLDCTSAEFVDALFNLEDVHFYGATSDMIKLKGWLNLYWRKVRFDEFTGYALSTGTTTLASGPQYLGVFHIDDFTADSKGACAGVFEIDNSTLNGSNLGPIHISNCRIELNDAPMTGNKGIITLKQTNTSPSARAIGLHLDNFTVQIVGAAQGTGDSLIYRETTDTAGNESIMFTNVRQEGLDSIVGGTWPTYWPTIPLVVNYGQLAINTHFSSYDRYTTITDQIFNLVTDRDSELGYRLRRGTESFDRLYINAKAEMYFGDGTAAADALFFRNAAGVMRVGGGGSVSGNVQTAPSATSTELNDVTDAINTVAKFNGKQVWNSTLGIPLYAAGSTAGSVWKKFSDDTTANTPV